MKNLITQLMVCLGLCIAMGQEQCPVVNINSAIAQNNEIIIDCDTQLENERCTTLSASYTELPSTTEYEVQQIDYNPIASFSTGQNIGDLEDDMWSDEIQIPFEFCFFGNNYDSFVISDNGLISFNSNLSGEESPYLIAGSNPNPNLVLNAIFGVFHDLSIDTEQIGCEDDPNTPENECGEITYQVIGEAPCRKAIINYNNVTHFACSDQRTTTQIVLHEVSNIIDIFVEKKPFSCEFAVESESLLGIIDSTGSLGYSPLNRNTGIWEAEGEAYRFQPIGEPITNVLWYQGNELIGSGDTIEVCPSESTEYKVRVEYGCSSVFLEEIIPVTFEASYPVAMPLTLEFCNDVEVNQIDLNNYLNDITVDPALFNIGFYSTIEDAQVNQDSINSIIDLPSDNDGTGTKTVFVRVSATDSNCFAISEITINVSEIKAELEDVILCDEGNDNQEYIPNLQNYIENDGFNYSFYLTYEEADSIQNTINEINVTENTTIYYRVELENSDCYKINSFEIILNEGINLVRDLALNYCSQAEETIYNLTLYEEEMANGNLNLEFTYFDENGNPYTGENPILEPTEYFSPDGNVDVQVLVVDPTTGCQYMTSIKISVPGGEGITVPTVKFCDSDQDGFTSVNVIQAIINQFESIFPEVSTNSIGVYEIGVFDQDNPYIIDVENGCPETVLFYINDSESHSCLLNIKLQSVEPIEPVITEFEICDIEDRGEEYVNLEELAEQIFPQVYLSSCSYDDEITFYTSQEDAISSNNQITGNYLINQDQSLFVKAIRNGNCEIIEEIKFNFGIASQPEVSEISDLICDNNNDGIEIYNLTYAETMVTGNPNQNLYYYFKSYDDAVQNINRITNIQNYQVNVNQNEFYLRANSEINCTDLIKFTINFKTPVIAEEHEQAVCDDGDLRHTFNLTESIPYMTEQPNAYQVTYHKTKANAVNGNGQIQNPQEFIAVEEYTKVFVKFYDSSTTCYSIRIIHLRIVPPPKLITNTYEICDTDFDGVHDENLTNLNGLIIEDPNNEYTYSYFTSLQNAQANINAIQNYENYDVTTPPETIFIRVENTYGCSNISRVELNKGEVLPIQSAELTYNQCDDDYDGFVNFNLMEIKEQICPPGFEMDVYFYENLEDLKKQENAISNPMNYQNTIAGEQIIYARVKNPKFCDNWLPILLKVNPLPTVVITGNAQVCQGVGRWIEPEVTGDEPLGFEWLDQNGNVIGTEKDILLVNRGTYTFNVTNAFGCTISNEVVIEYFRNPEITDIIEGWNNLEIIADGHGTPIEYSLDAENWQSSNQYYNLESGVHTVYVRIAEEGCPRVAEQTILYKVENLVTPNNDGKNDTWKLGGLEYFKGKESTITIFDRYGKVVHKESSSSEFKWDARVLGRVVPSGSYFYKIQVADGRLLSGHITIKNL